jgi:hypothetical protein
LINAYHEGVSFKTPKWSGLGGWRLLVDTGRGLVEPDEPSTAPASEIVVPGRSQLLFEAGAR